MGPHQNHAKKDTYFAYSFAREKRYIEEKFIHAFIHIDL